MISKEYTKVQVCHGSSALELFSDQTFCQQWDALYHACPWATATQTRVFAEICYSVYNSIFEPLIIYAKDDTGNLSGLFALVINIKTRDLVYVGNTHSEYQVWLSTVETGNSFIEAVIEQLNVLFPKSRLVLKYLPPNTPLGWLESSRPWTGHAYCKSVLRPLMAVGAGGSNIEESLRKKSNRSRINRLSKLGELKLEVMYSRQEIEPIFDRFVEFRDFRNAARYQSMPFKNDPLHQEFTLRLVDKPDIIHASVLRAGSEILAINIGARDKSSVQVGNITLSPFVSEHSPGKLLLLFLGRKIGGEGFTDLDLTPCGSSADLGYKQRFADHYDTAYICYIAFGSRLNGLLNKIQARLIEDVRGKVSNIVKSWLTRAGITTEAFHFWLTRIKQLVKANKSHTLLVKMMQWLLHRIHSDTQLNFYQMDADEVTRIEADIRFNRDSLNDLLLYEPATPDAYSKFEFLRESFARFEAGGHVFTITKDNKLLHYAWLQPVTGSIKTDVGSKIDLAKGSVMLSNNDDENLSSRDEELYQASIRYRLREAVAMVKAGKIFINVRNDNELARQIIERTGFQPYATVIRRFRWGKTIWQWHFEH
jgi:hypothetical protein